MHPSANSSSGYIQYLAYGLNSVLLPLTPESSPAAEAQQHEQLIATPKHKTRQQIHQDQASYRERCHILQTAVFM